MFSSKGYRKAAALLLALLPLQSPVYSAPRGTVGYSLNWTNPSAQYTFVFAGRVMRDGRPCANAHVSVDIQTANQGMVSESAEAGDDGRYQIALTVSAAPEQTSFWKLQARSATVTTVSTGEAEGRLILRDGQTTVVISETIPLLQA